MAEYPKALFNQKLYIVFNVIIFRRFFKRKSKKLSGRLALLLLIYSDID